MTPDLPISLWTLHQVDNSQLTTISNLLTNRTYTVSVLAYTSVGDGPLSEPIKVKTQQGGMYPAFPLVNLALSFHARNLYYLKQMTMLTVYNIFDVFRLVIEVLGDFFFKWEDEQFYVLSYGMFDQLWFS